MDVLDKKIENVLDQADRMFIATSVGGNSSGASVFLVEMAKIWYFLPSTLPVKQNK